MTDLLNIILVGGGKISCGKNRFSGREPMSHMEGIMLSPNVVPHAIVEPDETRKASITSDWKEASIHRHIRDVPPAPMEVIVICSPTVNHYSCILDAIEREPIAIIVEKPLCLETEHARNILGLSQSSNVPIYVNFNRRFDTRFNELSTFIPQEPIAIHVDYSNGINNYCSHFIDLILKWYGKCLSVRQIGNFNSRESDPNPSFFLEFEAGFSAYFQGFDDVDYDLLDMKIWHRSGLIKLSAGGAHISVEAPTSGLFYENYDHLDTVWQSSGHVSGFRELYDQLGSADNYHSLHKACELEMGVLNVRVINAVLESKKLGGHSVCFDEPNG